MDESATGGATPCNSRARPRATFRKRLRTRSLASAARTGQSDRDNIDSALWGLRGLRGGRGVRARGRLPLGSFRAALAGHFFLLGNVCQGGSARQAICWRFRLPIEFLFDIEGNCYGNVGAARVSGILHRIIISSKPR